MPVAFFYTHSCADQLIRSISAYKRPSLAPDTRTDEFAHPLAIKSLLFALSPSLAAPRLRCAAEPSNPALWDVGPDC